ncbi:MAG: carboxypeptidase regulatory-like domain-containing protein [Rubripirellula sp.]
MMSIDTILNSLLTLLIAVTVLSCVALWVGRYLNDQHPSMTDALYRTTVLAVFLIPFVHLGLAQSGTGWVSVERAPEIVEPTKANATIEFAMPDQLIADSLPASTEPDVVHHRPSDIATHHVAVPTQPWESLKFDWQTCGALALCVLLMGTATSLLRQLAGAAVVRLLLWKSRPLSATQITELQSQLGLQLGPRDLRRVRISTSVHGPVVMGTLFPRVVLPSGMLAAESPATMRAVLSHEFAHLQRRDPIVHAIARVVRSIYWWHPVVRMLHTQLRQTTETACDRIAVAQSSATEYAESLLNLSQRYRGASGLHLSLSMVSTPKNDLERNQLAQRIGLVLSTTTKRSPTLNRRQWFFMVTAAASLLLTASMPIYQNLIAEENQEVATSPNQPLAWTISGVVRDPSDQPTEATIYLRCDKNQKTTRTKSDRSGRFRFEGLQDQNYQVWATTSTGRTGSRYRIDDALLDDSGMQTEPINLKLKAGKPLRVRVVDQAGKPIAGAEVKSGWMSWRPAGLDGHALTAPMTSEAWTIKVRAPGHAEVRFESPQVSGEMEREVTLPAGTQVSGTVRDEQENTVKNAEVWVSLGNTRFLQAKTDEAGRFEIRGVPRQASLNLSSRSKGFRSFTTQINTLAGSPEKQIVLKPRAKDGVLTGIVLSHLEQPLANVAVKLTSRAEYFTSVTLTTDSTGKFIANDLYVDEEGYDSVIEADGHALESSLKLLARAPEDALKAEPYRIQLTKGRRYEALVVDDAGKPLKGVSLRANYHAMPLAKSDSDGRIVVEYLAEECSLSLYGGGFSAGNDFQPDFDTVPHRHESKSFGAIRGIVVDENEEPIERFRVRGWFTPDYKPTDSNAGISSRMSGGMDFLTTDGCFELKDLANGAAFQLIVIADGYRTEILRRAEVRPKHIDEAITFKMQQLREQDVTTIAGTLLDSDGKPASSVPVRLVIGRPNESPVLKWDDVFADKPDRACKIAQNLAAKTDQFGRFRFDQVQTGGSITLLHRWGNLPATAHGGLENESAERQGNLTLKCERGGTIKITIDPKYVNERILVDVSNDGSRRMRENRRLSDGTWTLDQLPPGKYDIEVWPSSTDAPSEDYEVLVTAGETASIHYPPSPIPIRVESVSALDIVRGLFSP